MKLLSYEDWYDQKGYYYKEQLEEWLEDMPRWFELGEYIDVDDVVMNMYNDEYGDYMDYCYDNYRDEQLFEGE